MLYVILFAEGNPFSFQEFILLYNPHCTFVHVIKHKIDSFNNRSRKMPIYGSIYYSQAVRSESANNKTTFVVVRSICSIVPRKREKGWKPVAVTWVII